MKPVAVFRHAESEGPGYFATFLEERGIAWELIRVDGGDSIPCDPGSFSGLAFLGGPMSVNDPLPWIAEEMALIRQAVSGGIPVLGHCLGGQLMAKALGGTVMPNPVKEIGWGSVTVADAAAAIAWFGEIREFEAFHWHGETFTLPPGATSILSGAYCANQAFSLGKHLAFQCHIEMSADMVRQWYALGALEVDSARSSPAVQVGTLAQERLAERIAALNGLAAKIYQKWIGGFDN